MILDFIINLIGGVVNLILLPLETINFSVNFISGITPVMNFISVISYIFPWNNLLPLIATVVSIYVLRIVVSLIKTIWDILPIV